MSKTTGSGLSLPRGVESGIAASAEQGVSANFNRTSSQPPHNSGFYAFNAAGIASPTMFRIRSISASVMTNGGAST